MNLVYLEEYIEAFKKSPEEIKELLLSENISSVIYNIKSRHNTAENDTEIARITGLVLVGLIPVKNFIKALQEDAHLEAEIAKNVAHDIREQIFAEVAEELAEMQKRIPKIQSVAQGNVQGVPDESVIREHLDHDTRNIEQAQGLGTGFEEVKQDVEDAPRPPKTSKPHKEVPESHIINLRDQRF